MTNFNWWTELTHGGIFISNPVLHESFDEKAVESWHWRYKRLRDHYNSYLSKLDSYRTGAHPVNSWIGNIFEDFLGHQSKQWLKGNSIPQNLSVLSSSGLPLKPTRVLVDENNNPLLLLKRDEAPRLGMHKGRRSYAQFVDLLRKTHTQLGILTNGMQIRLVYAGLDHDAWVQWQVDAWFDEGETRAQLDGLLTLLHPDNFRIKDGSFKLIDAVITSRNRQADLADVLGGQIRRAVESLTAAIGRNQQKSPDFLDPVQITPGTESILSEADTLNAVYQAATRLVMRKVVLFYAEAKELLPNFDPVYHNNYSLEGLYAQLLGAVQHAGEEELKTRYSAWQRFLALTNMVFRGSEHEALTLKAYGGTLFKPGDINSSDAVLRALSLFERGNLGISDYEVFQILRLIKIGKTKVRQGRGYTYVSGPVDFGDLRTEYIGMMYEGLLDYELKRVGPNDPRIILNIGDQPILSLSLLEPMDDKAIKNLFEKMKVESDGGAAAEDSDGIEAEEEVQDIENHIDDSTTYGKALQWALRAVEVARLVNRPRGAAAQDIFNEKKLVKARSLIVEVLEPGEMYLARWGGTRKGSGTFYTKPALAVPTTQRTLAPLVYDMAGDEAKVRDPQTILGLKICDPSVGSGTFLVAAARYLTEALFESVLKYTITKRDDEGNIVLKPSDSITLSKNLRFEAPPMKASEDGWEEQMKARLKRLVVEHCLFGVDLNGMAVELARLALWLETMDKDLPFEFLDHRIKQGNSLLGTWYKNHLDYPARAWEREGGDGPKGELTKKIKEVYSKTIKPQLVSWLSRFSSQTSFINDIKLEKTVVEKHLESWSLLNDTSLLDTEMREEIFYSLIGEDEKYNELKCRFDKWIALWFWPMKSNLLITPSNYSTENGNINDIVKELKAQYHFFHWELEFPEVFIGKGGFDAILGNPPWNTLQPESLEFFSNYDPIYRTYGKQEALQKQQLMFETDSNVLQDWVNYSAYFKGLSNFIKSSSDLFDVNIGRGRENSILIEEWRKSNNSKPSYLSGSTPYKHQGSGKIDLYQLFLELSFQLLLPGGRMGMITPSGVYTDKGSTEIRKAFLEKSNWEWLFAFENRMKLFDIDSRFKFGPIILTKGGHTESIKCAFMRHDVKDWESPNPPHMEISVEKIKRFSPNTLSFMEFKSPMDLEICEKIYGDRPLLGDQVEGGWNVKFSQEFNMTSDSHLFPPITKWVEEGYHPDGLGRWVNAAGEIALPVYEGRMIGQFDFSENGWVSGKGRSAIWRAIPFDNKTIEPQFLMKKEDFISDAGSIRGYKIPVMNISSATNTRTVIAGLIKDVPCVHSLNPVTIVSGQLIDYLAVCSIFNSFAYDYLIRFKMGGLNLSFFILEETVFPNIKIEVKMKIAFEAARLLFLHPIFIAEWDILIKKIQPACVQLATSNIERKRTRSIIDALIFYSFGLDEQDVEMIIENAPNNPIGFFRVDDNLPLEQRQTTLTIEAFKHLKNVGIDKFLEEGWKLPDYVNEVDHPGITVWQPDSGWNKVWAEVKTHLTDEEWKDINGETLHQNRNGGSDKVEESGQQGLF